MGQVTVVRGQGGLGQRSAGIDHVSGLLANGVATPSLVLGTVYLLGRPEDAAALEIDEAYDTDNSLFLYEHIVEFFRANPDGILYLKVVAQAVAFDDLVKPSEGHATDLLIKAGGKINQLGVAYNPAAPVADNALLVAAIPQAQLLVDWAEQQFIPCIVVLEAKGFTPAANLDLQATTGRGVYVFAGQNASKAAIDATYAAVGTCLGAISEAFVNESIAWVEKFNMLGGELSSASIAGVAIADISSTIMADLDSKHIGCFRTHIGYPGIYFNETRTAIIVTDDYSSIELNRVYNKASRVIRTALLPSLNGPITIDEDTGQIAEVSVKALEAKGNFALKPMYSAGEFSGPNPQSKTPPFTINPDQDVLATSNLDGKLQVVPTATARNITVYSGFINPNN